MAGKRVRKKRWKQAGNDLRCALCGRELWPNQTDYSTGRYGAVCHRCLSASRLMTLCRQVDETKKKEESIAPAPAAPTPQRLVKLLDNVIAGQEGAKRAVALAMWKQRLRAKGERTVPASHLLLYGPTGCGKTYLARRAADIAGLPSIVFDATTLSETGYRGRDAVDILKDYGKATEGHPRRGHGVIILDEVDKLAARGGSERQAYCRGTQHSLLKLLEGVVHEEVDSSNLLFILCGAFHGLGSKAPTSGPIGFLWESKEPSGAEIGPEDFVGFGMERELMGRVHNLAPIQPLTEDDLVHILLDKEDSAFNAYQEFFNHRGVRLTLPDDGAREIAKRALALGTGARALKAELDKAMESLMFRLAAGELRGDVVLDGAELSAVQREAG